MAIIVSMMIGTGILVAIGFACWIHADNKMIKEAQKKNSGKWTWDWNLD